MKSDNGRRTRLRPSGEQVTEFFNIPQGFFNCMVLDSQPTKSVPRRVRLAIERNTDEMCPNRNPQSRMQPENLDVRSVGTTRPLRGVALFNETCDLTDEDAEEAAIRACCSPNNRRILACIAKWPLPTGCCQMGKTPFQMSRARSTTDDENSAGSSFAEMLPFQSSLWHRHYGSSESVGS